MLQNIQDTDSKAQKARILNVSTIFHPCPCTCVQVDVFPFF